MGEGLHGARRPGGLGFSHAALQLELDYVTATFRSLHVLHACERCDTGRSASQEESVRRLPTYNTLAECGACWCASIDPEWRAGSAPPLGAEEWQASAQRASIPSDWYSLHRGVDWLSIQRMS